MSWSGGGTSAYVIYPLLGCGGTTPLDGCDATHITVEANDPLIFSGQGTLTIAMTPGKADDDFDVSVYRDDDKDGLPDGDGAAIDDGREQTGLGAGEAESLVVPNAGPGTYLVEIVNFLSVQGTFAGTASLDSPEVIVASPRRGRPR